MLVAHGFESASNQSLCYVDGSLLQSAWSRVVDKASSPSSQRIGNVSHGWKAVETFSTKATKLQKLELVHAYNSELR